MVDLTGTASVVRPDVSVETAYVVQHDADRLARLARLIDDRQIVLEVQELMSFDQAPEALEKVLGKHVRGKIGLSF